MLYRRIEITDEGTDEPVQYLGVYTLKWQKEWGTPEVAFVEDERAEADAALGKAVGAALQECGMASKQALFTLAAMNAQCGSEPEVGYILDAIAAALEAIAAACAGEGEGND